MINIIGQFFGSSGYANHTRYLANALGKLTDCKLSTSLPPNWERDVNDLELEMIKKEETYEVNLIITHPVHWRNNCSAKRNFVYLVWEGDKVPEYFLDECMNPAIEKIIVPSDHTYNALSNTLEATGGTIMDKVVIIPHGVDLDIFKPIHTEPTETFRFLANKGLTNLEDRGGLQYLIRAYIEEFKPDEDVELILKINSAYGVPNLLQMFPELIKLTPKINVITNNISSSKLNELYNFCNVFVSPTRGEAFNIPCLEAMACGKPVITTVFGGQADFLKHGVNGWLIEGELTEVQHDIQYEGIKWLTPNIEKLKSRMRLCFEDSKKLREMSKDCLNTTEKLTWDNTAKRILKLV